MEMEVKLRNVRATDLKMIYEWRNSDCVQHACFQSEKFSKEEHELYWKARLLDHSKFSFIVLSDGEPAGLLRLSPYDAKGGFYEIDIMVASGFQGKGIGTEAIARAKEFSKNAGLTKLYARLKPGNDASRAIFEKNGFEKKYTYFECVP